MGFVRYRFAAAAVAACLLAAALPAYAAEEIMELEIIGMEIADKEYDGDRTAAVEFTLMPQPEAGDEVEVRYTALFQDAGVGDGKMAMVTVEGLQGRDAQKYSLYPSEMEAYGGRIVKSAQGVAEATPFTLRAGLTGRHQIALDSVVRLGPLDPGEVTYLEAQILEDAAGMLAEVTVEGRALSLRLAGGAGAGQQAQVGIRVESDHYEELLAVMHIAVESPAAVTGVSVQNRAYDGKPFQPSGEPVILVDGTAQPVSDAAYHYTGRGETAYDSAEAPTAAGSYRLIITTPEGGRSEAQDFEILPANLTLRPVDAAIDAGDPLPEFEVRCTGLVNGETAALLRPAPQVEALLENTDTPAAATLVIANDPAAPNYSIVKESGTLTVRAKSSGSGDDNSSGGDDSSDDSSDDESSGGDSSDDDTSNSSSDDDGSGDDPSGGGDDSSGTDDPGNPEPAASRERSGTSGGSSVRDSEPGTIWDIVADRIGRAEEGGSVRVMAARESAVPAAVLRALRGRDVTLRIIRPDGDDILLRGAQIPAVAQASYRFAELAALANTTVEAKLERMEPQIVPLEPARAEPAARPVQDFTVLDAASTDAVPADAGVHGAVPLGREELPATGNQNERAALPVPQPVSARIAPLSRQSSPSRGTITFAALLAGATVALCAVAITATLRARES